MTTKQALEVIKGALDLATSKGAYNNLETSAAIIQAFNVLSEKITKEDVQSDEPHSN